MEKVMQQNPSGAEESASAAGEMNVQAEQMKVYVEALVRIVGGAGTATAASCLPSPAIERREEKGMRKPAGALTH